MTNNDSSDNDALDRIRKYQTNPWQYTSLKHFGVWNRTALNGLRYELEGAGGGCWQGKS